MSKIIPVITLLCLLPFTGEAHHFKGLPHFSYFENYPQVPQEEFLGQKGSYEFSLVIYDFQGIKREDTQQPEDVRLFLIIYNLRKNRVYNGPATLQILDRKKPMYTEVKKSAEEESTYSIQTGLPASGKYSLRVILHDIDDLEVVIPFKLSSQKVHWGKWVTGILVLLIVIVAIGSRRARIAIDRKDNAQMRRKRGSCKKAHIQ